MNNHILVVDDVALNIQVVANLLKAKGYQISFAQDGQSALEIVSEEEIDLILLDIMMPGMDGYEVCEKLKADDKTKNIPVIFLTARTETQSITKGFETGGVDYVTKPFNATELIARVSTHIRLQNALNNEKEQNLKLEELNQTKDRFFSILAHDLKTPFNSLFMIADLLLVHIDEMKNQEIKDVIKGLHKDAKNGNELINNLMTWSYNQRNRLEFAPELLSIYEITKKNFDQLTISARFKNIQFSYKGKEDEKIYADENMLNTIIRNLISNAIKFTHNGGEISVIANQQKDYTELTIKDTGIGIPPEKKDQLFSSGPGFTTYGTLKEKGTGLGLILCKEFVEKHGGKIRVESELNKGTSFILTFPDKAI